MHERDASSSRRPAGVNDHALAPLALPEPAIAAAIFETAYSGVRDGVRRSA
jgi:hypothetical protein